MTETKPVVVYTDERRLALKRDNHTCQYCETVLRPERATADHVIPLSRDGPSHLHNLKCACSECNHGKGARTLPEWRDKVEAQLVSTRDAPRPRVRPAETLLTILKNIDTILVNEPQLAGIQPCRQPAHQVSSALTKVLPSPWTRGDQTPSPAA